MISLVKILFIFLSFFLSVKADFTIVENIKSLREIYISESKTVWVSGFTRMNDGGQGFFYWDSLSNEKIIPGLVISSIHYPNKKGRWIRIWEDELNLKWMGAKGDGKSDDVSMFQSAIDYLKRRGGGVLYLPKGDYIISSQIFLFEAIKLKGEGQEQTCIAPSNSFSGIAILRIDKADNVILESFELNGRNSELNFTNSYSGIYSYKSSHLKISNLKIHNFRSAGIRLLANSSYANIKNCNIFNIQGVEGSTGIIVDDSKYSNIAYCNISDSNPKEREKINMTDDGNGVFLRQGSDGALLLGNSFKNCGRRAIKIQSSLIRVSENYIEDCAQAGIQIQLLQRDGGPIKDIILANNIIKGITYGNYGVVLESFCKNILISNLIIDNVYVGIEIRHGVQGVNISQCSIKKTRAWGIRIEQLETEKPPFTRDISISGCTLEYCGNKDLKPSIEILPGKKPVESVSISNSFILNSGSYSIAIRNEGHKGIKISDNMVSSFKFQSSPLYVHPDLQNIDILNNQILKTK